MILRKLNDLNLTEYHTKLHDIILPMDVVSENPEDKGGPTQYCYESLTHVFIVIDYVN